MLGRVAQAALIIAIIAIFIPGAVYVWDAAIITLIICGCVWLKQRASRSGRRRQTGP